MLVDAHVGERGDAALMAAGLAHAVPIVGDLEEEVEVEPGVERRSAKRGHRHLHGRLRVAKRERRVRAVHDLGTLFGTAQVVRARHAADEVAVHVHGQPDLGAQGAHELGGAIGNKEPRHILDAERVGAELGELARVGDVAVERVDGAARVGDGRFKMRADLFDGRCAVADVVDVVQGVEHAEDVDAVRVGAPR